MKKCLLGIDIGTTKVAMVLVHRDTGDLILSRSCETMAYIKCEEEWRKEQDVGKIQKVVNELMADLIDRNNCEITSIGFTGQMHGIVGLDEDKNPVTNLVTWEDKRGETRLDDQDTLIATINRLAGKETAMNGYGLTTLYHWLFIEKRSNISRICTISDFIALTLTHSREIYIDPSFAQSVGCYDMDNETWDYELIDRLGIDRKLFPFLCCTGDKAGNCTIRGRTVPVLVSIGDNQASFLGSIGNPDREMLINVGTGAQVCFTIPKSEASSILPEIDGKDIELRPYIHDKYLLSANSLNGGNIYKSLYRFFMQCGSEIFELDIGSGESLWSKMEQLGSRSEANLDVNPLFNGLRSDPRKMGSISDISENTFSPGSLIISLLYGLANHYKNLIGGYVPERINKITGSGNALRRNPLLRRTLEEVFGMGLHLSEHTEEAARGAALMGTIEGIS